MKKSISLLVAICMLFAFSLSLMSCSGEKGVPDSLAIESVRENKYITRKYPETVSVIHNKYDKEAYLDYVTIVSKSEGKYGYYITTCDAVFQYNRTTDLWDLFGYDYVYEGSYEVWTPPKATFNKNLVGSYDVKGKYADSESYEDKFYTCHIEILQVTEKAIKLSYEISADINVGFIFPEYMLIEKSGTVTLENGNIHVNSYQNHNGVTTNNKADLSIRIELPDGYCGYSKDDDYTYLYLEVDFANGIESARFGSVSKLYD